MSAWDLPPLRAHVPLLASEASESDGVRVVRFFTLEPRKFVLDDADHPDHLAVATRDGGPSTGGTGGTGGIGAQAVPRLSAKLTVRLLR